MPVSSIQRSTRRFIKMLSKRFSQVVRLFAVISFSYFLASCGDGEGPTPVAAAPCPSSGIVSFDSGSYAENARSAEILVTDACIFLKTVNVNVNNGTDTISVDVDITVGYPEPIAISPVRFNVNPSGVSDALCL